MFNLTNFKRSFSRWSTLRNEAGGGGSKITPAPSSSTPPPSSSHHDNDPGNVKVPPTKWDRKFLIWSGQYKNVAEIPDKLHQATLHKARTWARIRINIYIMIVTAAGCGYMVYLGKSASKRGESVHDMNLEWHRKVNEEYRKEANLNAGK